MTEAIAGLLAGLLIGSFLNVCIHRLPRDLSVVRPRSYCPACETPIAARDNIPILSYLLLGGRCRHCAARIPPRYPAVELLTAALFAVTAGALGFGLATLKWCLFEALMVGLLFSDLEERILPDEFTLGGAAAGLFLAAWVPVDPGYAHLLLGPFLNGRWLSVAESAAGAVAGGALLWLAGWLYQALRHKEGLGLGDVKMLATIGAFMGLHGALQALVLGSLAGSVLGLAYIKLTKKDYASYQLPLGAFLGAAAILIALLQGPFRG
ncbi:MAG: prepilin peptidase [Bryobacterales bacterium]|nr:prepilin peptidase [Bryobacterales bacterium]